MDTSNFDKTFTSEPILNADHENSQINDKSILNKPDDTPPNKHDAGQTLNKHNDDTGDETKTFEEFSFVASVIQNDDNDDDE